MKMMLNSQPDHTADHFLNTYRSKHQAVVFNRPRPHCREPAHAHASYHQKKAAKFRHPSLRQQLYTTTTEDATTISSASSCECLKCKHSKCDANAKTKPQPITKQKIIDFGSTQTESSPPKSDLDAFKRRNKCYCGFEDLNLKESKHKKPVLDEQEDEEEEEEEEIFNIYSRLSGSPAKLSPLSSPKPEQRDSGRVLLKDILTLKELNDELEKVEEEDENESKSNMDQKTPVLGDTVKTKTTKRSVLVDSSDEDLFDQNSQNSTRKLDNKSATTTNTTNDGGELLNSSLVKPSNLNAGSPTTVDESEAVPAKSMRISRLEKLQRPHSAFQMDEEFSQVFVNNIRASVATPTETTFSSLSNFNSVSS